MAVDQCGSDFIDRYFHKRLKVRQYLEQYIIKDIETKEYYESILKQAKIKNVRIAVIPGERQSAIFGVIRPIMVLPDAVLEEKTVAYMIQHEIKHYANYDLPPPPPPPGLSFL